MFGKLLKNDLKAQWHSMSFIFLCTFIVAAVAEIFTLTADNEVIMAMGGLIVTLALAFACIIIIIAVAMMFSKTMFGRAGYLTLTLPVKTGALLTSKTISGLIWVFTVFSLFLGSIFLLAYQIREAMGEDVMESAEELLHLFGVPSFLTIFMGIFSFCLSLSILILVVIQSLQLSITLSHVSPISKFGNFGAIIIFFVLFAIIDSVASSISEAIPCGFVVTEEVLKFTSDINKTKATMGFDALGINIIGTLIRFASAIALHFPTKYLIKHKVSVK